MLRKIAGLSPRALVFSGFALLLVSLGCFLLGTAAIVVGAMASPQEAATDQPAADDAGTTTEVEEAPGSPSPPRPGLFDRLRGAASSVLGEGAARGTFRGGKPAGLWFMTKFWLATNHLEKAVWYFAPDGRLYVNPEGITDDALAAHKGQSGTYDVAGNNLTIKWSDGSTSSNELERDGDGFAFDTGLYAPVDPFTDQSALAGSWEGGSSMSFGGGSSILSKSLVIAADGTFTQSGAASIRAESDESVASAGGTSATRGRWSLDGYTMTLTYENGEIVRGVAFPFDDEETVFNPDRFYFAGIMYKNSKAK